MISPQTKAKNVLADALTSTFWDPEKEDSSKLCSDAEPQKEWGGVYVCFKLLKVWWFIMPQQETNAVSNARYCHP